MRRDDGFTLIEVLVALAILATVLGVAYSVFSDSLQRSLSSEQRRTAAMYAQSKLALLGNETSLENEPRSGVFDDTFAWTLAISDYGDEADRENWPLAAKLVALTVSWADGTIDRSFTVTTLRLMEKE